MGLPTRLLLGSTAPLWCGAALCAAPAAAAQQAGSAIVNVAVAEIDDEAGPVRLSSNAATVRIDELLDIALASPASAARLTVGTVAAVPFMLTNRGNGVEGFALSGALSDIDGSVEGIAVDVDGNGAFDPAVDRLLGKGEVASDRLAPGGSVPLLLLVAATRIGTGARVSIAARALTGSGQPGSVLPGRGDGGTDAIVGATTAAATMDLPVAAGASDDASPSLTKSQSVVAPDGSARAVRGAVITYTLAATFRGTTPAGDAAVSDPIPARTSYVAGSLTLDDARLSDADDGDPGGFDGSAVRVALGSVGAPATHTIRFQVTIK